jgi:hypothetical protein
MSDLDVLGVEHYQFRLNLLSIEWIGPLYFVQEFVIVKNFWRRWILILKYNEIIERELIDNIYKSHVFLREVIFYELPQNYITTINEVQFVYKINKISDVDVKVPYNQFFF